MHHLHRPPGPALFLLPLSPASPDSPYALPPPPPRSTSVLALTPLSPAAPPPPYPAPRPPSPPPTTRTRTRTRTRARTTLSAMSAPSSSPPPYSLTPPEHPLGPSPINTRRAASSPHLRPPQYPSLAARRPLPQSDCDDSADDSVASDDDILYTASASASATTSAHLRPGFTGGLRARILGNGKAREDVLRPITTAPGALCAGETETEGEDSPRNLPTARITRPSLHPALPLPHALAALMPALVSFSRLLAIVPAVFGTLYHLWWLFGLGGQTDVWRGEFLVAALWAILTGWQCLQLTTGLLKRWRVYYSPLPTLIRLFALQAICWPATHLTLTLLAHERRPALCWAVVGTTTCCSRSIQLWVTSNIAPSHHPPSHHPHPHPPHSSSHAHLSAHAHPSSHPHLSSHAAHPHPNAHSLDSPPQQQPQPFSPMSALAFALGNAIGGGAQDEEQAWKRGRRRRWDWAAVGRTCALPAGVLYFVTAWAEMARREVERGRC